MIKKRVFMNHFYHKVTSEGSYLPVADYQIVYYLFGYIIKTVFVEQMSPTVANRALKVSKQEYSDMIKEFDKGTFTF